MSLLYNWKFYILLYLAFSVVFNNSYKITTRNMINSGTLTVLIQIIASLFCILLIPCFKLKFSNNIRVYIFLFIAIIFYTLNDRLGTISRSKLDVSIYSTIKQLSTVFMIVFGVILFKESVTLNKILGSFLIVLSNVLILNKKGTFVFNKYVIFGILANISLTIAILIDVNYSKEFNLSIYVLLITLIPAILICIFEKIKLKNIITEYKVSNKSSLYLTAISWVIMMISKIKAYTLGELVLVAIVSSLTVILTVIFSYIVLKERDSLIKKIVCATIIIFGIILVKC